ncbi:hypothetical protein ACMAZF_20540 (plasmid) [Psychrobium sp. nBUS_13]|uniref:hypothetical protein n=1 Tax=Psychrobium sp. nBUS_13 TaxID=3395319 RepID=UPI003EBCC0DF
MTKIIGIGILTALTCLTSCTDEPWQPIPKEGDVVMWKHRPELIIKAKLGQRREHVITHPQTDHRFYEPEFETFIGQFPIDYDPQPYATLTEQEYLDFEAELSQKILARKSIHHIEFYLMLNGAQAKATDRSIFDRQALDDINQVKVELHGRSILVDHSRTTKDMHDTFVQTKVNKTWRRNEKLSIEYGLQCFTEINGHPLNRTGCFGESGYEKASGVDFSLMSDDWIYARSYEPIYGGITINYRIDKRRLKQWRQVDAAIWRLLERWNVSPLTTSTSQQKELKE